MEPSRRITTIMVVASIALHALAMVWLSVPEPAAHEPEEVGVMVSMAAPAPQPEPQPEPEPEPEVAEAATEPVAQPAIEPVPVAAPMPDAIPMLDEIEPRLDARPLEESPVAEPVEQIVVADPVVAKSYEQELVAWLSQHKRYPKLALRRGIEGDCVVRIVIGRNGRVQSSTLESSAGNALLDRETLAMVERASPFPAPPDDVPGQTLEYVIPVSFDLQ